MDTQVGRLCASNQSVNFIKATKGTYNSWEGRATDKANIINEQISHVISQIDSVKK